MLNKVVLMGRLTQSPELRRTPNNTAVTSFTLAVSRYAKKGETPQVDFIDVVAWKGGAEFAAKWFTKGMSVAVAGRLQVRDWTDRDGRKRRTYEVVAEELYFAGSKNDRAPAQPEEPAPITADDFDVYDDDGGAPPWR